MKKVLLVLASLNTLHTALTVFKIGGLIILVLWMSGNGTLHVEQLIMVVPFKKLCTLPMRLKVITSTAEKSQKDIL